jgi:hypothetical protein
MVRLIVFVIALICMLAGISSIGPDTKWYVSAAIIALSVGLLGVDEIMRKQDHILELLQKKEK